MNHGLLYYWDYVKPLLRDVYKNAENIDLVIKSTESYLEEFEKLDDKSFRFRYPFAKNEQLTPFFSEDLRVDTVNLKMRMNELYNILENLEDSLDDR